mmetsp:Transcript_26257/g.52329  ORF Transcript_26257/g.52329 Transcript_26257/m.52329 type:complete len:217 (+) Transcript_26257:556-1206(+)
MSAVAWAVEARAICTSAPFQESAPSSPFPAASRSSLATPSSKWEARRRCAAQRTCRSSRSAGDPMLRGGAGVRAATSDRICAAPRTRYSQSVPSQGPALPVLAWPFLASCAAVGRILSRTRTVCWCSIALSPSTVGFCRYVPMSSGRPELTRNPCPPQHLRAFSRPSEANLLHTDLRQEVEECRSDICSFVTAVSGSSRAASVSLSRSRTRFPTIL